MDNEIYQVEAQQLANKHYQVDPSTTQIELFPLSENKTIKLLEVSSEIPASGCIFPISFSAAEGMTYSSTIIVVAQEDYNKIKNNELQLPADWGKATCGIPLKRS